MRMECLFYKKKHNTFRVFRLFLCIESGGGISSNIVIFLRIQGTLNAGLQKETTFPDAKEAHVHLL